MGSRTQAQRRATTDARLLEAAFKLVAEDGVRAVTTAAVGELAGYSRGIVNHHFGSRGEMMVRLAEEAQRRFRPSAGARRGRARVLGVVDQYLAMIRANSPELRVFLRLWAAAVGGEEPSLREQFTDRDALFRDYFIEAITEGQVDGSIRADLDPAATAIALVGLLRGIAMQAQYDPRVAKDKNARRTAVALLDCGLSSSPKRTANRT